MYIAAISSGPGRSLRSRRLLRFALNMTPQGLVWIQGNVLGPVPRVDVMAKRPQGLLNVGGSFRADGGAAFLRSALLTSSALRFSLAICSLATFPWPPPPSPP
jgi:hypothetical protein